MSWSSVALYTLTGTLTSPKEIEPFQIERIVPVCPYLWADMRLTLPRRVRQCIPIRQGQRRRE